MATQLNDHNQQLSKPIDNPSEPDWLSTIRTQLYKRDISQKIPFVSISSSYNRLLDENVNLFDNVNKLSQHIRQLKQDTWNKPSLFVSTIQSDINNTTDDGSNKDNNSSNNSKSLSPFKKNKNKNKQNNDQNTSPTNYEMEAMKEENASLRKELMDVYRLKRENEEALSRLKKQTVENEELIMQRGKSLDELSYKFKDLSTKYEETIEANERLKSGLAMLNKESIELRKAHDNGLKELDQYKEENRVLTEQLLKLKESQMDQLHEWQQEFEKYRKINAMKLKQKLNDNNNDNPLLNDNNDKYPSLSASVTYPNYHQQKQVRRHTTVPNVNTNNANKHGKKSRWSIGGFLFGKNDNHSDQKTNNSSGSSPISGSAMLASIFGKTIAEQDINGKKGSRLSQSVDFNVSRAPIVDLYGPSLFNITPPQLKSKMWQGHSDDVCGLQFDSTGKKLISCGTDKLVKIWDSGSGQELSVLRGCTSSVICCKYSPNYAFICAGGNDCQLHLWNVKTQRQIRVYNGHTNKITSLAFTSDSRWIFSGSHDRTIKLWDLETAACRYTMSAHSSVYDLTISPDEYYLASAHLDGCIRFWSKRDRKELFKLSDHKPQQAHGVQFSPPDGIQILTSSKDGRIIIWDLRKQQKLHEIFDKDYKNTNITGKPSYSPDGQYIIGGSSILGIKNVSNKYPIFIWKTKTAKLQHKLTEHTSPVTSVIWHGRGGVASSDRSGQIAMWC